jgi:hypothetical protein
VRLEEVPSPQALLGPYDGDLPCKRLHEGFAQARFESALKVLGWPNINEDGTPIVRK